MIRFIDLTTGKVFNGDVAYDDNGIIDESASYVHWFEEAQSTGLTYVQKVCVLSNYPNLFVHIPVKSPENIETNNDIFKLVDVDKMIDYDENGRLITKNDVLINGTYYQDIQNLYSDTYISHGAKYGDYYVHMIYFAAQSNIAIEARQLFYIQETEPNEIDGQIIYTPVDEAPTEYFIGADFYDCREELKIDMGNAGVEIPESVQKAIYPSNLREDAIDNILLNRKYKELLLNFMDVVGNKGSYKSLINSLKWFEYPDNLFLKEFWKKHDYDNLVYNMQDFEQVLSDKTKKLLSDYIKTTYIGIYCACQNYLTNENGLVYEKEKYPSSSLRLNMPTLLNAETNRLVPNNGDGDGSIRQQLQIGVGEIFTDPMTGYLQDTFTDPMTSLVSHRYVKDTIYPGTTFEDHRDIMISLNDSVDMPDGESMRRVDFDGSNFQELESTLKNKQRFIAEPIPELSKAVFKWSKADMAIKMALLGNFYETYFMPIHLDLIHSTLEDIVYTNAIKIISGGQMDREDYILHNTQIECNIKDGQIFRLADVDIQADTNTPYVSCYFKGTNYKDHLILGVSEGLGLIRPSDNQNPSEETIFDVKNILLNNYHGIGVLVPLEFTIPANKNDVLFKENICLVNDFTNKWENLYFENKYQAELVDPNDESKGYQFVVKLHILCTRDRNYDFRMRFFCTSGMTYIKRVMFEVIDTQASTLEIYKIKSVRPSVSARSANDYMFTHLYASKHDAGNNPIYDEMSTDKNVLHSSVSTDKLFYTQYIPSLYEPYDDLSNKQGLLKHTISDGAKLKMIVIIRENFQSNSKTYTIEEVLGGVIRDTSLPPSNDLSKNYINDKPFKLADIFTSSSNITPVALGVKPKMTYENVGDVAKLKDRTVVADTSKSIWSWLNDNFTCYRKIAGNNNYLIFVAKRFNLRDNNGYIKQMQEIVYEKTGFNKLVLRNDLIYVPQDHYLTKLNRNNIKGVSVRPYETLCVIPNMRYLKYIDDYEWVFRNASSGKIYSSTDQQYVLPSVKEPFIASTDKQHPVLDPGYYDITFRYKLTSEKPYLHEGEDKVYAEFDKSGYATGMSAARLPQPGGTYLYIMRNEIDEDITYITKEQFEQVYQDSIPFKHTEEFMQYYGIQEVNLKSAFIMLPMTDENRETSKLEEQAGTNNVGKSLLQKAEDYNFRPEFVDNVLPKEQAEIMNSTYPAYTKIPELIKSEAK